MDAFKSLHPNHEEFVCLTLLDLLCISPLSVKGFLGLRGLHPIGFTGYPTITNQGIPGPNQRYSLPWFTIYPTLDSSALWLILRPPHSTSNPSGNLAQPKQEIPITPWISGNGKARLKTTVTPGKTHANDNKRTKTHMNVRCMPKLARKSYLQLDTCK